MREKRKLKDGEKWAYEPNWYLAVGDDFEKGARCADCGKQFIRTEMTDNCPECWEEN